MPTISRRASIYLRDEELELFESIMEFALTMWGKGHPHNFDQGYMEDEMMPFARELRNQIQGWKDPEAFTKD